MKKKADVKRIVLIGIPMLLLAIGVKMLDDDARVLWFERNGTNYTKAQFYLFSGHKERAFSVEKHEQVQIEWTPALKKGRVILTIDAPEREMSAEKAEIIDFKASRKGKIKLRIEGQEARGSFEIRWDSE